MSDARKEAPTGIGKKEQRQYEYMKEAKQERRYRRREKELAARTVLKQHKGKGHSKAR